MDHSSDSAGGHRTDRAFDPTNADGHSYASNGWYSGTHAPFEWFEEYGGGNYFAGVCAGREISHDLRLMAGGHKKVMTIIKTSALLLLWHWQSFILWLRIICWVCRNKKSLRHRVECSAPEWWCDRCSKSWEIQPPAAVGNSLSPRFPENDAGCGDLCGSDRWYAD